MQECRGLDAGPRLVHKLKSLGDSKSSEIMNIIVNDEINQVKIGLKWFKKFIDFEIKNTQSHNYSNKKNEILKNNENENPNNFDNRNDNIDFQKKKEVFNKEIRQNDKSKIILENDEIYYLYYNDICKNYLTSAILPPFNKELRNLAGIPDSWISKINIKI